MRVKDMHMMRMNASKLKKRKHSTPLAKEIEARREEIIRGIIGNAPQIVGRQLEIASLPVTAGGDDNDTVLKATTALLDRAFGKPKESIDFSGNVQFSLKELATKRLALKDETPTPLEDMI